MKKQITFWLGAVLLWAALDCSQARVIPTYFEDGGNIDLRPTGTGAITNILWKYNGNLLAEWVKGEVELFYYDTYKGRTTLDPVSGRLEVKNMNKTDEGLYTVEINNKVHGESYNVKAITRVPKPSVVGRTLTCNPESEKCLLTCGEEPESLREAEPIEYSWKMGEKDWEKKTKDITITKTETEHVKTIFCRMKNPVSQEDSKPFNNPMYEEPKPDDSGSGVTAAIVIPLLLLLAVGGGVGGGCWWLKNKRVGSTDIESHGKEHPLVPSPSSPEDQPNGTPDAQPDKTPDAQPDKTPDAQPDKTPDAQPNKTPDAQPSDTPETEPSDTPETEPLNPPGSATVPPASE